MLNGIPITDYIDQSDLGAILQHRFYPSDAIRAEASMIFSEIANSLIRYLVCEANLEMDQIKATLLPSEW